MAFELPTLPNFNTNIPQMPSPLDQYGKMLQLKSLLGQQSMLPMQQQEAQQRVQSQGLQLQQQQLELKSQQAMMKAWSNPDFLKNFTGTDKADASGLGFDPDGLSSALISQGVLPKDAMAMTNQFVERSQKIAETQKAIAQTGEANASQRDKGYKILADQIGGILDAPTAKAADLLTQFKQDLVKNPQKYAGVPQEDLAHVYGADLEHLPAMATVIGLDSKIADFHKSKLDAQAAAQKVISPDTGMSQEQQADIKKSVETARQEQPLKIAQSIAEGQARANIEAAQARGSNAALANVPPHLVAPASAAASKAGQDFAQKMSVSDRLKAMMDAAKEGNVVSYQLIPQEGALQVTTSQGVHRINMAEIQNYGGGSLWQRLQGHIGKELTGKSIPQSVLDDMSEMQKIQEKGATAQYNNELKTINQNYGATFQPVQMEGLNEKPKSGDFFSQFGGKAR